MKHLSADVASCIMFVAEWAVDTFTQEACYSKKGEP